MNNLTWSDVHQYRFDWAKTAHTKFMQKFDPNLYHTEGIKDQVYIIVYGASQVGKTSLILELIGIMPEHYNTVQNVLRGNRSFGKSATSTVVRYYTSTNEYWYISDTNLPNTTQHSLSDKQATRELADMRAKMESLGTKYEVSEISIGIPNCYIKNTFEENKDIVIRDLPGIKASNKNEQSFVKKVVKQRVEQADLIFLMTTIDNIGFVVHEDSLELDELVNWHRNPSRFKVIFTRFYSNKSSYDECIKLNKIKGHISREDIRSYIKDQINTLDNDWNVNEQIFALEVGDTWNKINLQDNELSEQLKNNRSDFFAELSRTILDSADPITRLCYGYQIGDLAQINKENEEQIVNDAIKETNTEIDALSNQIKSDLNNIRQYTDRKDRDEQKYTEEVERLNSIFSSPMIKNIVNTPDYNSDIANVTDLISHLNKVQQYYREQWTNASNIVFNFIDLGAFPESTEIFTIYKHLKEYSFSTYFISSSRSNDISKLNSALQKHADIIVEHIKCSYESAYTLLTEKYEERVNHSNIKIYNLKNKVDITTKKMNKLLNKNNERTNHLKSFIEERNLEIEHSRNFSSFIDNEFHKEVISIEERINKQKNDINKINLVFLIRLIRNDYLKIKGSNT